VEEGTNERGTHLSIPLFIRIYDSSFVVVVVVVVVAEMTHDTTARYNKLQTSNSDTTTTTTATTTTITKKKLSEGIISFVIVYLWTLTKVTGEERKE